MKKQNFTTQEIDAVHELLIESIEKSNPDIVCEILNRYFTTVNSKEYSVVVIVEYLNEDGETCLIGRYL